MVSEKDRHQQKVWRSRLKYNGQEHYLGTYETQEEAFQARLAGENALGISDYTPHWRTVLVKALVKKRPFGKGCGF